MTRTGSWLLRRLRRQRRLVAELALRDYRHEWVLSGCSILALAAVLIPLLVLFGLKYGIIQNLLGPLVENPRYREIAPLTSGNFDPQWFASMRARSDVAFIVPRSRSLAAIIDLRAPQSEVGRIITVELVPSGPGDPSLEKVSPPKGLTDVVLSSTAAAKLHVQAGDRVEGVLTRTLHGKREAVRLPLRAGAVAPDAAFTRDGLFVSVELMAAVEDFLDGRAVPKLGWEGAAPRPVEQRTYASFRLYARSIDDVAPLHRELLDQRIDVRTSAADIALVQTLNRNLSIVYWIIAVLAIGGYCLSFGSQVWANVDRKRREFSVLRLTGFRTAEIVWFPILQAAFTAFLAWLLACIVFLIVQAALNTLFASSAAAAGGVVCRLRAWHLFAALGLTLLAAGIAATLGGRRVAQLEPSIGLRED
ncbi:MAG TPA: FtsX-like permease family protein [Gammaproteobacteria bacterium]|nr:FtsX-like permease family protein [Gammaproteobacteria bacterium]